MSPAYLLGAALASLGAIFFSAGSQLQFHGVNRTKAGLDPDTAPTGGLRHLLAMARDPWWLGGFLTLLTGCGVHLVALMYAPISLVQPIGALSVPLTVAITAALRRRRPSRAILAGALAAVGGIIVFAAAAATASPSSQTAAAVPSSTSAFSAEAAIAAVALAAMAIGWRGKRTQGQKTGGTQPTPGARSWTTWAPLGWGVAGGIFYGLATAQIKHAFLLLGGQMTWSLPHFVATLAFIGAAYGLGIWSIQLGYATSAPELMVACTTVFDPVVAVTFGFLVLGEAQSLTLPLAAALVLAGATALGGLTLIAVGNSKMDKSA